MVNFEPDKKVNTHVGVDTNPVVKLYSRNEKKVNSQKGKHVEWFMEMIIGPFLSEDEGRKIKEEWNRTKRGIPNRREKGKELALRYQRICWDSRKKPEDGKEFESILDSLKIPKVIRFKDREAAEDQVKVY